MITQRFNNVKWSKDVVPLLPVPARSKGNCRTPKSNLRTAEWKKLFSSIREFMPKGLVLMRSDYSKMFWKEWKLYCSAGNIFDSNYKSSLSKIIASICSKERFGYKTRDYKKGMNLSWLSQCDLREGGREKRMNLPRVERSATGDKYDQEFHFQRRLS